MRNQPHDDANRTIATRANLAAWPRPAMRRWRRRDSICFHASIAPASHYHPRINNSKGHPSAESVTRVTNIPSSSTILSQPWQSQNLPVIPEINIQCPDQQMLYLFKCIFSSHEFIPALDKCDGGITKLNLTALLNDLRCCFMIREPGLWVHSQSNILDVILGF